jgi:cbb3-type cytochrome oxidase subunit 1
VALATSTTAAPAQTTPDEGDQPSAAALTWVTVGASLLMIGGVLYLLTALQELSADVFDLGEASSFERLRPVAHTLVTFGGLGMLGTGVALDLVRRLGHGRAQLDLVARAAGALTTLGVVGGSVAILLGHGTDRAGVDLPWPFAVPVALGLLLAAVTAVATTFRRPHDSLHPSGWHLLAALAQAPVLVVVGIFARGSGVSGRTAHAFSSSGLMLLWLVSLGVGIALYVVPTASRAPLHSRQLALIGFWGWVLLAPLAGLSRLMSEPTTDRLESIGAAASVALVVPALAIAINLFATYSGRTSLAFSADVRLGLLGAGLLVTAAAFAALEPTSVGDTLHDTYFSAGLRELWIFGAAAALVVAGVYHCLPGLTRHRLANPRFAASHAWLLVAGAGLVFLGLAVAGYTQGALLDVAGEDGAARGVLDHAARPLLNLRLIGEALLVLTWVSVFQQVFSTSAYSDPLPETGQAPGSALVRV